MRRVDYLRIMRLGWYSRLVLVGVAAWALGAGTYRYDRSAKATYNLQSEYYSACTEREVRGEPFMDRMKGESCGQFSDRQFDYMFGWDAYSNKLMQSLVEALLWAMLAIPAYWAARWVWAGRRPSDASGDSSR